MKKKLPSAIQFADGLAQLRRSIDASLDHLSLINGALRACESRISSSHQAADHSDAPMLARLAEASHKSKERENLSKERLRLLTVSATPHPDEQEEEEPSMSL